MSGELAVDASDIVRLLLALLVGGLIGAEREFRDKAAGFRTITLICVGSALFTMFSVRLAGEHDPARIAAQIVTGVGFLGAGVILHQGGEVRGLTTASTIWLAAALGMGLGGGYLLFSCIAAAIVLFVLWVLPGFDALVDRLRQTRTYEVTTALNRGKYAQIEALFRQCGLRAKAHAEAKREGEMVITWTVHGPQEGHRRALEALFADPEIRRLRV